MSTFVSTFVPSKWLWQTWTEAECAHAPQLTTLLVRAAALELRRGATCSEADMIVVEMIFQLSEDSFEDVTEFFAADSSTTLSLQRTPAGNLHIVELFRK